MAVFSRLTGTKNNAQYISQVGKGQSVEQIASVAGFFLSRIDVLVHPMLNEKRLDDLKGETAVALARKVYKIYRRGFSNHRFRKPEAKGATPQQLLWASTSRKDPYFSDVSYVETLIGPKIVSTIPIETPRSLPRSWKSDFPAGNRSGQSHAGIRAR